MLFGEENLYLSKNEFFLVFPPPPLLKKHMGKALEVNAFIHPFKDLSSAYYMEVIT